MQVKKFKKCKNCGEEYQLYRSSLEPCPNKDCRKVIVDKRNKKKNSSPAKKKYNYIKPISDSMAEKLAVYRPLRDKYMLQHTICQFKDCQSHSNDLHHIRGRGPYLSEVTYFMAICRPHHQWIDVNTKEARKLGYLI